MQAELTATTPHRTLGFTSLVGVAFFCVCGGAYGLEDPVKAAGPIVTLLAIIVLPWVWSVPMALMTAELSAAMPEDGGYVVWVERAFGRFWGFQEGWWSWLCNTADNAMYPVLFVKYLKFIAPQMSLTQVGLICAAMIAVFAFLNVRGAQLVGASSVVFTLLIIAPFAVMVLLGTRYIQPAVWQAHSPPLKQIEWAGLLSVVLWNFSGWDNVGCCAGEVKEPGRIYPRALMTTVAIMVALYVSAIAVGVSVKPNRAEWETGYFAEVAKAIGGDGFGKVMMLGGMISAAGLFNALLLTSSRVPFAMASRRTLPPFLARVHPRFATPWVSIIVNAVMCALLVQWAFEADEHKQGPFVALAEINMLLYSLALVLEYAALMKLRVREPQLERPYRIPGGTLSVGLMSLPPIALCFILMAVCPRATQCAGAGGIAMGLVVYVVMRFCNRVTQSELVP